MLRVEGVEAACPRGGEARPQAKVLGCLRGCLVAVFSEVPPFLLLLRRHGPLHLPLGLGQRQYGNLLLPLGLGRSRTEISSYP